MGHVAIISGSVHTDDAVCEWVEHIDGWEYRGEFIRFKQHPYEPDTFVAPCKKRIYDMLSLAAHIRGCNKCKADLAMRRMES